MKNKENTQSRTYIEKGLQQGCRCDIEKAEKAFSDLQTLMGSYELLPGDNVSEAVINQMFQREYYVTLIEKAFKTAGMPEIVWRKLADEKIEEIRSGKFLQEYDWIRQEVRIHSGFRPASIQKDDIAFIDGHYELKEAPKQAILDAVSKFYCSEAQSRAFDLICDILPQVRELAKNGVNVGRVIQMYGVPQYVGAGENKFLEFDENEILRQIAISSTK